MMTIEKKANGFEVELALTGWMDTQRTAALDELGPEAKSLTLDLPRWSIRPHLESASL